MKTLLVFLVASVSTCAAVSLAKPGCLDSCGQVVIPYPFGMGSGCYMNESFAITCNPKHRRPFLTAFNVEVFNISLEQGTLHINTIAIYDDQVYTGNASSLNLEGTPHFSYSATTVFVAFGCDVMALIIGQDDELYAGCATFCTGNGSFSIVDSSVPCLGTGCCQIVLPLGLKKFNMSIYNSPLANTTALLVDKYWLEAVNTSEFVYVPGSYYPLVLDWHIFINETPCQFPYPDQNPTDHLHCGNNVYSCSEITSRLAQCRCAEGFEGNPYLSQGCQDVNECSDPGKNNCTDTCHGSGKEKCTTCHNIPGSYYCSCPHGYHGDARRDGIGCFLVKNHVKQIFLIGTLTGVGLFFVLMGTWWFHRLMQTRKKIKMKEFYFKRNGGLLLQQPLYTKSTSLEKSKLFTLEELDIASDHFNENRILGKGGQSTVYKGMSSDGTIIAIKRFKLGNEAQVKQFINEIVILSQINHRNVAQLLGCCLETEVPLLVYEFIPNGTLSDLIQAQFDQDCPVSQWLLRLQIATEVARAISYLHSAASFPIYHKDIKSTNILLDSKYRAKVADFGISRLLPSLEQTHVTTQVKGTFGYLDPEYFRSGRFTEKSDVYSFGVVLVELLTGQKPIVTTELQERRSLVDYFLLSMEENRFLGILDPRVAKEENKEDIMIMANLAKRCLNMNGKNRPSIQEIAVELDALWFSKQASSTTQEAIESFQEQECSSSLSSSAISTPAK